MTRDEFITIHIEAIMALESEDAKKKELTVLLTQYLLSYSTKEVKFCINDIAQYTGLEVSFLNQPHDTFKNLSYAAPLMDMFGLGHILIDENKYQSLTESSLLLLMSADVNQNPKKYFRYTMLSSVIKSYKDDEFFASEFEIFFSDDFWDEFIALV